MIIVGHKLKTETSALKSVADRIQFLKIHLPKNMQSVSDQGLMIQNTNKRLRQNSIKSLIEI